ncbi:MAG: hypothetical protein IKW39_05250 [Alphaproteobacteria bacterium]|nr:hypothetical protein [Alphaproteobacteria bacterium]
MENYIEGRVVLGVLCLIHLLFIFASQCPWGHIKAKVLDGIFLAELIMVTAYVMYDNMLAPPYIGWFWAIVGYLFVYALIVITWLVYGIFTLLDEDKVYEMKINQAVNIMSKDYFKGTVTNGKNEYEVYLPYSSDLQSLIENNIKPNVKFDRVIKGIYVIVKRV